MMMVQVERIGDLSLEMGGHLEDVHIAFATRGTLAPGRDNVILVLHGYTSGPDMILPTSEPTEGSWRDLVGPGKPIDTDRYFVLCPNALGSTYGSTGSGSISSATGRPYGSAFPAVTMRDVVASQRALLDRLGIEKLVAAVGPSFGGGQALQWAVSYPDHVERVVAALVALGRPPTNVEGIRAGLARDPHWNGGDYYDHGNLIETLVPNRIQTLNSFGVDTALSATIADPVRRQAIIARRAREWAENFDANALLVIMRIFSTFDITADLDKIQARLLYVLSRTDHLFPPSLAPTAMASLKAAGVDAEYFEIDSENGHSASSSDSSLWAPVLRRFLEN
jgi:homoserine O-acetyltransferase